jgi:hypothetical protein
MIRSFSPLPFPIPIPSGAPDPASAFSSFATRRVRGGHFATNVTCAVRCSPQAVGDYLTHEKLPLGYAISLPCDSRLGTCRAFDAFSRVLEKIYRRRTFLLHLR